MEKVAEEFEEVKAEIAKGRAEGLAEEIGDLLFAVANLARMCGVNAEEALYNTNNKFVDRFEKMENLATENGQNLALLNISEKIELWNKAKNL